MVQFPKSELTLGELEALAGTLLAVLLTLMFAGIASEHSELFELGTKFEVEFQQCARHTKPTGFCLTRKATAVGKDECIKLVIRLGGKQGLPHRSAGGFRMEVLLEGAMIDGYVALTRTQEYASRGGLAASGSNILI